MALIKIVHKGDFEKTTKFLSKAQRIAINNVLNTYGKMGVEALKAATPVRTGKTADSWTYSVSTTHRGYVIYWENTNTNQGIPIVVLIQSGHGTGTGGYVPPLDFINPTMNPIFDKITEDIDRQLKGGA
jgi:hypothetical protein